MKKSIFTFIFSICLYSLCGQYVTRDANGNYFTASNKGQQVTKKDSTTIYVHTDNKNVTRPVYCGPNGGHYIWRQSSKTGKMYKQYLPKEIRD